MQGFSISMKSFPAVFHISACLLKSIWESLDMLSRMPSSHTQLHQDKKLQALPFSLRLAFQNQPGIARPPWHLCGLFLRQVIFCSNLALGPWSIAWEEIE